MLVILLVLVGLALLVGSYEIGRRMRPHSRIYYVQASLAFGHYRNYGVIADLLEKKCYDDALTMARYMRDVEKSIFAENLRRAGNDPELLEYIKLRDPELLKSVLAGPTPGPRDIWTTCR